MSAHPAAGGGRWVVVDAERLTGWLERFVQRHGRAESTGTPTGVTLVAADGEQAHCLVPFPPLTLDAQQPYLGLVTHAMVERRVGVLLVRRGGFAAGVFQGERLLASRVGARPVQGRTAAGGWSQQRFARRRHGQVTVALSAAADAAAAVLVPAAASLDAVVLGGDRGALEHVMADPRLGGLSSLVTGPRLEVPDPRRHVLLGAPGLFRTVRIRIVEHTSGEE
ncbi:MAG: acVLRF1 family peptidyl-tRNA hydrolase [Actinomycetes bacterium]